MPIGDLIIELPTAVIFVYFLKKYREGPIGTMFVCEEGILRFRDACGGFVEKF